MTNTMIPPRTLITLVLAVSFTTVVEGLGLAEFLPLPAALLAGACWGVVIGLIATWLRGKERRGAWAEDALVFAGVVAMAFFAFGGATGILLYGSALDSPSLTGQTLVTMFLPSIPLAILANAPTELVIVPGLLVLAWRPGKRRILILGAAALYLVHRVWTYLVFASDRLDFADTERSTAPLTAAQRQQFAADLHLDDPRWMLNLVIFAVLLLAAFWSRVRELDRLSGSAPGS
jgi:hypothetical protein